MTVSMRIPLAWRGWDPLGAKPFSFGESDAIDANSIRLLKVGDPMKESHSLFRESS